MRTTEQVRQENVLASIFDTRTRLHTPDDSVEWAFLGRAYHQIAQALFPDWEASNLNLKLPELLPDAIERRDGFFAGLIGDDQSSEAEWYEPPSRATLEYALNLLYDHRPDVRQRPLNALMSGIFRLAPPRFTMREWAIAQEITLTHYEEVRQALHTKREVDKAIARLCEAGTLRTCLRPPEGGDFSQVLPPAYWRTESYGDRFKTWCMVRDKPFSTFGPPEFIFVERSSLAVTLQRLKGGNDGGRPADLKSFVSDQIAFMLRTAATCGVSAENAVTVEAIKAQLVENWPWDDEPGKTELRYMATFIRNRSARQNVRQKAVKKR
jgi:hypothetical protein